MRNIKVILIIVMISLQIFINTGIAYASEKPGIKPKFVMLIINRVGIDDFVKNDLPNIKRLSEQGAVGLMNVRTSSDRNEPASFLSIGAGLRANATPNGALSFNYNEYYNSDKAGDVYNAYTGFNAKSEDIVNIGINNLIETSTETFNILWFSFKNSKVVPGLLGQTLKDNNIPVCVLGNSDTLNSYKRYSVLIGMDEKGLVAGDVSTDLLRNYRGYPFLLKTDYNKLYQKYIELSRNGGVSIIDLGDTGRADEFNGMTTPELVKKYRNRALENADKFLGSIVKTLNLKRDTLIVISPYQSNEDSAKGNLLTPVIVAGPGYSDFLTSPSTKRTGIIQNIDIAPSILNFYGISKPEQMPGLPIESIKDERNITPQDKLNYLYNMNQRFLNTNIQRPYFIRSYVLIQIITLLLAIFTMFLRNRYIRLIKPLILANLTVPLAWLVLPAFNVYSAFGKVAVIILFAAAMIFLFRVLARKNMDVIMALCIATSILIMIDVLTGQKLMKESILGYDPMAGARYYGIGNEYMGVLIGASIIGFSALIDRFKKAYLKYIVSGIFIVIAYLIGAPNLGTNVGGFIAAIMAFGTSILMLFGVEFNKKTFSYLFIFMVAVVLGIFLLDMIRGNSSHIGRTAIMVKEEGIKPLLIIFARKISMNLRLIKYTIWTRVLIAFIMVMTLLFYKPSNMLNEIFKENKALYCGFIGSAVGMIFSLIFNDSGIIAASTMFIFVVPVFLTMVIDKIISGL